jgi:hypothetical protein
MSVDNLSGKESLKILSKSCCRSTGRDEVGPVSETGALTFCAFEVPFEGAFFVVLCRFLDIGGPIVIVLNAVKVLSWGGVGSR